VRTYNFSLAVDRQLVWGDLGLTPKYPTIHAGIPAVIAETKNSGVQPDRQRPER